MDDKKKPYVNNRPQIVDSDAIDCPILDKVDILVVGGSQSGVAAAVCAARAFNHLDKGQRKKRKIMLIEQNNYLGGQSVTNMVTQWEIPAFRMNVGLWQIKGIGLEMVERIVEKGGSDKLWEDLMHVKNGQSDQWPFLGPEQHLTGEEGLSLEAIKLTLLEMCEEAGIDLLLDTRVVAAIQKETDESSMPSELANLENSEKPEGIIATAAGVVVEHYGGRGAVLADCIIDASANAVIPFWIGGQKSCKINPPEKRGLTQSYLWIGGVDMKRLIEWANSVPEDIMERYPNDPDQLKKHAETGRLIWFKTKKWGQPQELFERAADDDKLDILFKSEFTPVGFYMKWVGCYPGHGQFAFDGPYYRKDSLNGKIWTKEHMHNLYGSWGLYHLVKHIPGFENSFISRTCERMGLRTTRIPKGLYTITGDDLKNHRAHPDAIGVGDWHDTSHKFETGKWGYHVPLRALISKNIDNVLFCTRSVSFGPGAMNAHRGIGTTIVCGQGAGVAAAVSIQSKKKPRDIDYKVVREILEKQNVVTEIPEKK